MARDKYCETFKLQIIEDLKNGEKQAFVAKKYSMNRSIVCRLLKKKYKSTKDVAVKHLGGRPRKTSARDDRKICHIFQKKNPFASSNEVVKSLNLNVHDSTVRRRAIENNLKSYRPAKKPLLTKKHIQKR